MSVKFIHLRVHTEFSLVDGIVRIKPLVKKIAAAGMPAVAVTDQNNLFGLVKFYRAAMAAGIKPIVGVDLWVSGDSPSDPVSRLVLLVQNREGYLNLTRLISRGYIEGQHQGVPIIQKSWLNGATEGLIALSGGREGNVGVALLAKRQDEAAALLNQWCELFPDRFYLELQRTGREREDEYIHAAVDLAIKAQMPVVATNDVRFIKSDEFDAHEARVCINQGRVLDDPRRPRDYSEQQYLRTPEEMVELFSDIPEALENTVEIAKRCNIELTLGKNVLPDFPVPEGVSVDEHFRDISAKGLDERLELLFGQQAPDFQEKHKIYHERLKIELDVIIKMGFPGYFLIVADFIQWAKDQDIPVGPGRGSGAGSIVAYALKITDLDPIEYELLFERFLNPERVSMPDFDIDFCMEGRDRVIEYVAQTYGRDRVSQIITYGTMAAKAVVRDVGRVLGYPYGLVDKLAKLIPFELGITLTGALEQEEELKRRYDEEDEVKTLFDLALSLEGVTRNAGKHAGGVVISPSALTDFTPLYCEEGASGTVTQFDKNDVEAVGLVKFDFLGLRTLTIIDWALKTINRQKSEKGEDILDITQIPLDDKETFVLLKNCATTAVFQLESRGMKDLIKRLQPDCFEEIIALVALFRPGPLQSGMVDDFINRKHGRAKVEFPHPDLEPVLSPTYGVILYQEQVMQIAQVLAKFSLGAADLLRRAMGKKNPAEMAKQRVIFTEGAVKNSVKEETATYIFDLMEKFAGYGFNKSHSAAYALVSYQTAWLKTHYPAQFMAAVLSADMDNTDKVVMLVDECQAMKINVLPPDVNLCKYAFAVPDNDSIIYGLGAIKGVGAAAIESIVDSRNKEGIYKSLFDFCQRIDLRKANRRVLDTLVRSGALDQLGAGRSTLMATLIKAIKLAEQTQKNSDTGQTDLFGSAVKDEGDSSYSDEYYIAQAEWSDEIRLTGEKETLGLYLTGHPIDRYESELKQFISSRLNKLQPNRDQNVTIAGLVVDIRTRNSRKGDRMAFIILDDRTSRFELAVFPEAYSHYGELIIKDQLIVVSGSISVDDYSGGFKMSAEKIYNIAQAREMYAKRIEVEFDSSKQKSDFLPILEKTLDPFREGICPVNINYQSENARARLVLGADWRVSPTDEFIQRIKKLAGDNEVQIIY
ncbi:MAG: DNA polymerase III subunit alpha [Gammaproteobacteria bacterium]|nr:DNA polymerase III subunit alpha [Gammaproteobacteria bacterium]